MDLATFAAQRNDELLAAIERLLPKVRAALASSNIARNLLNAALMEYTGEKESQFIADLDEALELTTASSNPETVAGWLAVAALNASIAHSPDEGQKTWVTMLDNDVRDLHVPMHGVTVDANDFFDLAGVPTFYPGQPIGPIEHWINCRCVLGGNLGAVTAAVNYNTTSDPSIVTNLRYGGGIVTTDGQSPVVFAIDTGAEAQVVDDDEEPPVPDTPYDLTDDEPMMWHAIMTVEGRPSGDKRSFERGALEWRDLPLPLEWQKLTDDEHKGSVVVGRIDAMVRKDMGDHDAIRSWGVFTDNPEADDVISLIAQKALRGISPTVDNYTLAAGKRGSVSMDVAKGRMCSGTIVNVPAFAEAYLALGPPPLDWLDPDQEGDAIAAAAHGVEHYREFTKPQRDKAADEGHAMPDGSFPIKNVGDLRNAIQAIGRAKDPAAVKRHIRKRARALGHPELIPDSWGAELAEVGDAIVEHLAGDYELHYKRGAGWVTHPRETSRLHRYWTKGPGAAKIGWGTAHDFYRCRRQLAKYISAPYLSRTCAQWHHDALGYWPGEHRAGETITMSDDEPCPCETIALVASAATATKLPPAEWFKNPQLDGPTPLTVTREGRVFGHLATWGTCHLSFTGECVEPPHSKVDYAYFATGVADTDEGEVPVGTITMGTFHADDGWDAARAREHYEHTGMQAARVAAGEDEWGIWLAGQMMVMSEGDFATFRASSPSGDWRRIRGNLELVGTLAVNVPGYPVPRATLVASGGKVQTLLAANILEKPPVAEGIDVDAIADAVVRKINAAQERARRAAALQGRVRAIRAETLSALTV